MTENQLTDQPELKILVVDDHRSLLQIISKWLLRRWPSAEIKTAANVTDAHQAADGWAPDILVADIRLPDGDGFDMVCALHGKYPDMKPVLYSAIGSAE